MSESHKGQIPWTKGKHLSEETKRKISESLKNSEKFKLSCGNQERIEKIKKSLREQWKNPELRKKRIDSNKGKKHHFSDKQLFLKNVRKARQINKGKTYEEIYGEEKGKEMRKKRRESNRGEGNPFYGRKHSEESKRKMSKSKIGRWVGENSPSYGKPKSEETKRKLSEALKGRLSPNKGIPCSEEAKKKVSRANKLNWSNPEFVKRMYKLRSEKPKPNKVEKKLRQLLNKIQPHDWKYNGDFSQGISIGGKIPDFVNVNGKKAVIELFGQYWHSPLFNQNVPQHRTYDATIKHYKKYGFDCLIIWDEELQHMEQVKEKIGDWMEK